MKWNFLLREGHSYYESDGNVAVADASMRVRGDPTSTDDGLLLLDQKRTVQFLLDNRVLIPLLDAMGKQQFTSGDWGEGLAVVTAFNMQASYDATLLKLLHWHNTFAGMDTLPQKGHEQ